MRAPGTATFPSRQTDPVMTADVAAGPRVMLLESDAATPGRIKSTINVPIADEYSTRSIGYVPLGALEREHINGNSLGGKAPRGKRADLLLAGRALFSRSASLV